MAYIGRQNLGGAYRQLDDISSGFDGSDTTHTMQVNSQNVTVGDVNQIILSLGGVIQKPGTDFTVSGSTLTFTTAPASGLSFFAILLGSDNGGTVTPTDGSVTTDKFASNATLTTTGTVTTQGTSTTGGTITLENTDTGGAANDYFGKLIFKGNDSSSSASGTRASVEGKVTGNFGSSQIDFLTASGGASATRVATFSPTGLDINQDITHLDNAGTARTLYDRSENLLGNTGTNLTGATLFIGGTGSANQLDDYEEGTWTPSATNLPVNTVHKAIYRKIGDIVFLYCDITLDSSPSDSAQATSLAGFPFSCNDDYFQCNSRVTGLNQTIEANIAGTGAVFRDKSDGVICTRSEFAGDRCQHIFIYTIA